MSGRKLYTEISTLIGSMRPSDSVTERRKNLTALAEKLSARENKLRLLHEAGGANANIAKKQNAFSVLWNLALKTSFNSVQLIFESPKSKATPNDVSNINILVKQYVMILQDDSLDPNLQPTPSQEIIGAWLGFCTSLLEDQNAIDIAEASLLEILQYLCSSRVLVGFLKKAQVESILSVLFVRLDVESKDDVSGEVFQGSLTTFHTLLSACEQIGIDLQSFMPSCMDLISSYFVPNEQPLSTEESWKMLDCATILMNYHPEQAIASLERDEGQMLRKARHLYVSADGRGKDMLVGYFQAHM
jgi:hypothetical protein